MNSVCLVGRLGRDPKMSTSAKGTVICKTSIAVKRRFVKPGDTDVDWIELVMFGKTAEFVEKYLAKGTLVSIEGRLQISEWTTGDQKKYMATVVCEDIQSLVKAKPAEGAAPAPAPAAKAETPAPEDDVDFDPFGDA